MVNFECGLLCASWIVVCVFVFPWCPLWSLLGVVKVPVWVLTELKSPEKHHVVISHTCHSLEITEESPPDGQKRQCRFKELCPSLFTVCGLVLWLFRVFQALSVFLHLNEVDSWTSGFFHSICLSLCII